MVDEIFSKAADTLRRTGERIQEIRNEVGGPEYVEERTAALRAVSEGRPLAAIEHKFRDVAAAGRNYEEESALSRLKRVRDRQRATEIER